MVITLLDKDRTFQSFGFKLDTRLLKAVARLGFVYPTLVQSKTIPLALEGKDVLVRARTGSGKTAAFGLPLLHKILLCKADDPQASHGVLAVILVPTKELCDQTFRALTELSYYCRDVIKVQALLGDNVAAQQALLRDVPDVLISTPARLLTHLKGGNVKLKESVKTLVMDEADLILSFGYDEDVKAVVASLPRIYQGMLMSATLSPELDDLKRIVLHSPAILKLEEGQTDGELLQFYVMLPEADKFLLLFVFLKLGVLEGKGLFFVNSIDACYRLKLLLEQFSIRSAVLNAELPLNSRLHTIQEFNRGIFDYLIATDESMDTAAPATADSDEEEEEEAGVASDDAEDGGAEKMEGSDDGGDEDDGDDAGADEHEDEASAEVAGEEKEEDQTVKPSRKRRRGSGHDRGEAACRWACRCGACKDSILEARTGRADDPVFEETYATRNARAEDGRLKQHVLDVKRADYGVHRGIDFKAVNFVVNVDFPLSVKSYTHRVGRTARGGANGTALSLVVKDSTKEHAVLAEVQSTQLALPPLEGETVLPGAEPTADALSNSAPLRAQPSPLAFDLKELEGFRYRIEDVKRAVTRVAVREARLQEIKQELLNSEALRDHFEENPHEFQVLRHDKGILPSNQIKPHLKHVPDYLLPKGMRVGPDPTAKKRKRRRGGRKRAMGQGADRQRRKDNDPLQSFEGAEDADIAEGGEDDDDGVEDGPDTADPLDAGPAEDRIYREGDYLGESTAGRVLWKMRHKKGKFATKPRHEQKKKRRL